MLGSDATWCPEGISRAEMDSPPTDGRLGRGRRLVPHAVLLCILVPSLLDIARDREHWPFSNYPMYSQAETRYETGTLRLYGVLDETHELPLLDPAYIAPFDASRLRAAFTRLRRREDRDRLLRVALSDCLERYERGRRDGAHTGPPLSGMRLYELRWSLERAPENVDDPDGKELVAEVRSGEAP
jgi:hypothetical protein